MAALASTCVVSKAARDHEVRRQYQKYEAVSALLNKRIAQYLNRYHTGSNGLPTIHRFWNMTFKRWMFKEQIPERVLQDPHPIALGHKPMNANAPMQETM
jgi:hypothetical protein